MTEYREEHQTAQQAVCLDCGRVHVMGCDECGADLDVRGHFADCSKEADIRRRRKLRSARFDDGAFDGE